jgi:hypothetical protein
LPAANYLNFYSNSGKAGHKKAIDDYEKNRFIMISAIKEWQDKTDPYAYGFQQLILQLFFWKDLSGDT